MGPVDLLRNKRKALVRDDEAILLLALGSGPKRPHELFAHCQFPDRSFWRCLNRCHKYGWVESSKSHPTGKGVGPGLKSVVKITGEGERIIRCLCGAAAPNTAREVVRRAQPMPIKGAELQTAFTF